MLNLNRNYSPKKSEIERKYWLIDAKDLVVGRLAASIALLLRGKNSPKYASHMDSGNVIIVVNADKVYFSGKKLARRNGKVYYHHTGYPGGLKEISALDMMNKHPERILKYAVRGMMPKNKLANTLMSNLYIYSGPDHKHAAQKPEFFDFGSMNSKNKV